MSGRASPQPQRIFYDSTPASALAVATMLERRFLRRVLPDYFDRHAIETILKHGDMQVEPDPETLARIMHFHGVWCRDFFPTFDLTHGLTTALLLTESDSKKVADIVFPYPAFRIGLPGPDYSLTANTTHGTHPIVGILVLRVSTAENLKAISDRMIRETAHIKDPDERFAASHVIAAEEIKADGSERLEILLERASHDCDCGYIQIPFKMKDDPDRTVGDVLDGIMKSVSDEGVAPDVAQALLSALHAAARIALNLALYLAPTPNGEPPRKPVRRTPVTHADSTERVLPKVWVVGQDVKLPKLLREDVARNIQSGGGRAPWRLQERISVRAHRQHYWVKDPVTGQKVRTLKAKGAYEKGPDSVEACIRHYTTMFNQNAYQGLISEK